MTDPDVLDCKIHELKEVQRTAWRQLADSSLTTFERREVRNQIRQSNNELRQYLQMMSESVRFRVGPPELIFLSISIHFSHMSAFRDTVLNMSDSE